MNEPEKRQTVLRILRRNGRLSTAQIAERAQLNADEVDAIIAACEHDGTIFGYHTLIDPEQLGQEEVRAIIEVSIEPERDRGFDCIARNISKFEQVADVTLVSGTFDLMLTVVGASLQEVAHFVATQLAPIDGVKHHTTHFVLKKYKEAGFCREIDEDHERLPITP
mgnify:CR=1 FL=1